VFAAPRNGFGIEAALVCDDGNARERVEVVGLGLGLQGLGDGFCVCGREFWLTHADGGDDDWQCSQHERMTPEPNTARTQARMLEVGRWRRLCRHFAIADVSC